MEKPTYVRGTPPATTSPGLERAAGWGMEFALLQQKVIVRLSQRQKTSLTSAGLGGVFQNPGNNYLFFRLGCFALPFHRCRLPTPPRHNHSAALTLSFLISSHQEENEHSR